MNAAEILQTLKASGKDTTAQIYRRHGALGDVLGVLYSDLAKLQKRIKTDHATALEIWASGIHEARVLATQIADPTKATRKEIDTWLKDCKGYPMVDALTIFVGRTSHADACMKAWIESKDEWVSSVGWGLLGQTAMNDTTSDDAFFATFLKRIESEIRGAPNRTRSAMNKTLIALGTRNENLKQAVLAAAKRIGKVVVDHGDTDCKTPDAQAYILKTWAHREKKH